MQTELRAYALIQTVARACVCAAKSASRRARGSHRCIPDISTTLVSPKAGLFGSPCQR
jgi:hypothetical protein